MIACPIAEARARDNERNRARCGTLAGIFEISDQKLGVFLDQKEGEVTERHLFLRIIGGEFWDAGLGPESMGQAIPMKRGLCFEGYRLSWQART